MVGTTPLINLRIARGEYILALEKPGSASAERTLSGMTARVGNLMIQPPPIRIEQRLIAVGSQPDGMVFVPAGEYRLAGWSRPTDRRVPLADFFIDRYEVTNTEYKAFINAGGYVKREYWKHPFVDGERQLTWEEAMVRLVDRTGLPGPRSWSNQTVPDGKADHPVTDISWYEAAAYAAFRGKDLPSIFQWDKAARNGVIGPAGVAVMPWGLFYPGDTLNGRANFGTGTTPVASAPFGMSPFGAYNMAGNVAEWTRNDSTDGYLSTGGSWGDPTYMFALYGGRPGFFSSSKLGLRLVRNTAAGDQGGSRIELAQEIPQYSATTAAQFAPLAAVYHYEPGPLDARVEESVDTPEWRRERITFNAANGDRATAYLYLPNHVARPLQVMHYVPAGDVAGGFRPLEDSMDDRMAPFVKAGRAAFGVVLRGYIGRPRPEGAVAFNPTTVEYQEDIVRRVTDLRRGLDYLQTRTDLDLTRLAFFGPSAGAQIGLILAAVEPRYHVVVMIGAGLPSFVKPYIAPANPINFASHIKVPKLILQGRFDEDTPLKAAAEPLFRLLAEPKRLALFDGGHVPSNEVMMSNIAGWLDETMGRVTR